MFQWQRELRDRFRERFEIIRGADLKNAYGVNPWHEKHQVITSMDWAKREDVLESLCRAYWDLVIVDQNPVHNFKVLYGTGHFRLDDATNRPTRVGGVKYTIKDGIIYDAKKLLADVARMVAEAKRRQVPEANAASR
jgi:hypothetical protein